MKIKPILPTPPLFVENPKKFVEKVISERSNAKTKKDIKNFLQKFK